MYLRFNVGSLAGVRAMNAGFLAARPDLPPLIALDQEGGQVRRLTPDVGFAATPSARTLATRGLEAARAAYADLGARLAGEGFTLNFGPVVDLDLNPANPVIGRHDRAFGDDPQTVAALAAAFVDGHRAAGVATALKHFPGHGSSAGDTHDGFVDVTPYWQPIELEPYRILIGEGRADMVMVAHIHNGDYASDGAPDLPASLAPGWIEGVLRGELGHRGVVISDDMQMSAVTAHFGMRETVVRSVMAGNDILLFSNTAGYRPELGAEIHAILVEEARSDPAFAARVAESYGRIVELKRTLGASP